MTLFAIGVGGTGAKCLEALTHLHACGLLGKGRAASLGTFLVDPDQQSALLLRAQTAISRYGALRRAIGHRSNHFALGDLRDYGHWSPLSSSSGAVSLDQVFPKAILNSQASGLASLFDCLFPPEEQAADLEVGFRGRPAIGAAVMNRINLEQEAQTGQWQQMLSDIKAAAGQGEAPVIHLFGSVFGGTGASGVPSLGLLIKNWLSDQNLGGVRVQASLLLPYFDFEHQGDSDTGVHAESRNFQLNTDAALQYLRGSGSSCFDRVFLVGSDQKARYGFSIGGTSQTNAAHLVELLAALGVRHTSDSDYAFVLSRTRQDLISWEDIPDEEVVGRGLATGARFAVAWLNNFSQEIDAAQQVSMRTFLSGAPWARRFFSPSGSAADSAAGCPSIRAPGELSTKVCIDQYCETLLQWLQQLSSNLGKGFEQDLFGVEELVRTPYPDNNLHQVVRGKTRSDRQADADTVEAIKISMDVMPASEIQHVGIAGLADTLWTLCA
ncbi:hypothetical protein [Synechococcus sp. CS-603]|uniref:hypothetical protein n=1 Tax=Synechococcus sp. CS-603 TaxID=2847981 RepID=UPI00223B1D6D|nr:hypothetical protein [Synechococcus sp. CS-603]MCT0203135.1 hypothetical protein [Synechococcus sp. CS-603]